MVWTIGHSTHSFDDFLAMLSSFQIELVADVRRFPGSRRLPQFNKETLAASLEQNKIRYVHLEDLGGRLKPKSDSKNTAWRNEAFRGYADYMETDSFREAVMLLKDYAMKFRTAYMCSEAVWWRCHRALISDYLKVQGWQVMHIMGINKSTEHPYTSPARIIDNLLTYRTK
jgi:uncharacterized protein (DUF488 family)